MSGLEKIAALEKVTIRQVRRWCKQRRVPARKRNGWWHVNRRWLNLVIQREANKKTFLDVYGPKRTFEATLLANGICDGRDWQKLRRDSPEKYRFLYLNYQHHPLAHQVENDPLAYLRVRIELQVQRAGRVLKVKELAEELNVSAAQLYRAERGLIKKLKRRFSQDPTAPPERQPLDKPWLSAAKKKPKEKLNWRHDGKD